VGEAASVIMCQRVYWDVSEHILAEYSGVQPRTLWPTVQLSVTVRENPDLVKSPWRAVEALLHWIVKSAVWLYTYAQSTRGGISDLEPDCRAGALRESDCGRTPSRAVERRGVGRVSVQGGTHVGSSGRRTFIRNFVIEILIYGLLVVGYFLLVLRLLGGLLKGLVDENLTLYAFVALVLIVLQGALLELITSFLVRRLGLERLE